ncbi:MAG: response regulator [FCB group bacterium]|nr:response regulator [FCB group bacterium]
MNQNTILVIDDDIDLVEILRINLENAGYTVQDAQSGDAGFKLAKKNKPNLILLDVMMGAIDEGFQTAYQIKQDPETKDIPVVMLTAVTQQTGFKFDPVKDEAFLPVDEFLEKPINPKKLLDVVRKHLVASA